MSEAFGTNFIVINDTQQILNPKIFQNGPWMHIASVVRGLREYMCFKHVPTDAVYIEEVDPTIPTLFKKIKSDNEFNDLRDFLKEKGLLSFGVNREFKVAK
jgi:hypothetical protein